MSRIVGIDLGTTNSLLATVDSGIPIVIADDQGHRMTPSIVHIPESGDFLVGQQAKRLRILKPTETVSSVKRFMGSRATETPALEELLVPQIKNETTNSMMFKIHGQSFSPEAISAEILKKIKRDADAYFGEPVDRAVITVPAYFNDAQRNVTKKAGELAGFTVERIVNEPTAAALAYGLDKLNETAKIAVYDLGGGTFDLSILEISNGVFQVLATNGDTRLGGDDLDRRVTEFILGKIQEAGGPEIKTDPSLLARVRAAAETAKIQLTTKDLVDIELPFLTAAFSFSCPFSRQDLENLTHDIIERTRQHCIRSLADASLSPKDLDHVILVGGQTRMPLVRKFVSEIFHCRDFESVEGNLSIGSEAKISNGPLLNTSQNPDEAIALGAAIQAEILAGGFQNLLLLDVTPLSLGIETFGGLMNVLIPRNSTIPIKAGEVFTTAVDNQPSMLIHVLQGERERAADNWSLGRFAIDFELAPRGVPRVGVQFEIDANGILHVLARDIQTGRQKIIEMKSAVDVNDTDVQKMVEESVEHAFEDLAVRRWIESKLRAQETLSSTRKALVRLQNQIDPDYQRQVEQALSEVENTLSRENPESKTGDLKELQSKHAALDEITKTLADQLMDQVMDEALQKRGLIDQP